MHKENAYDVLNPTITGKYSVPGRGQLNIYLFSQDDPVSYYTGSMQLQYMCLQKLLPGINTRL
jgi:hypothetical protein